MDAYASHEKARRIFGARDTVPLAEGVARMAAWAKERGPQPTPVFGEIEVIRNLPPAWRAQLSVDGA
jgi:UDP-glucose 4-epimerase